MTSEMGSVIFGALLMGALLGLIPGIVGYKKGKQGLAIGGFIACVVGSFLLGLALSIPACIIFTAIILISSKKEATAYHSTQPASYNSPLEMGRCGKCGNSLAPGQRFCPSCGASQSGSSDVQRCPSCGNEVPSGIFFCNNCGAKLR